MNFQDKKIIKTENEINMMSPLTWAYVGDSVYELYIRTHFLNTTNLNPHKIYIQAIKYVKAPAQAKALQKIEEMLTDKEKEMIDRIRCRNGNLEINLSRQDTVAAEL